MADLNIRKETEPVVEEDYTMIEVGFWILGILMIPLVPIVMVAFLTPFSGM